MKKCTKRFLCFALAVLSIIGAAACGNGGGGAGKKGGHVDELVIGTTKQIEGLSILENAAHLGLPIPEQLKDVLEQLHNREEKSGMYESR